MKAHAHLRAILFAISGYTLWVFGDSAMKLAAPHLPPYEIVSLASVVAATLMLMRGVMRSEVKLLWPKRPGNQVVRAALELGNVICIVIALKHMTLTMFYIVVFTAPMVIALLAAILLRERLDWARGLAIIAGFAGVVIAVDPFGHSTQSDWIGYAACAVCVACFSLNIVWLRRMTQTETTESMVFFSNLLRACAAGSVMLWHAMPLTWFLLLILFIIGLCEVVGDILTMLALKVVPAATVSQYHYTQLIAGAVIGYLVWHEMPTLSMCIGSAIIVAAGLYIAARAPKIESLAVIGTR